MSTLSLSPAQQKFWYVSRIPDSELTTTQLVEAALAISWEEYPHIDLSSYRDALDGMASDLRQRLQGISYPLKVISEINRYLFEEQNFCGNEHNYYDPRNSFLTDVISRRMGIPLTLSMVYMAIGDRIGFPLEGVSLPGHFILRPQRSDIEVFIDPFAKGEIMFKEDCAAKLVQIYGPQAELKPEYLETVGVRRILERMLMNLKLIYLNQKKFHKALSTIEKILMLWPNSSTQIRDHGLLCYQLERYVEARSDLETYLDLSPYADDAELIQKLIDEMT
ncbi:MAG: tetratricopeptide repeat protein [Pseudanabaena sp. RU_4_16]|nr:tetratricopeptide repeat protein [Pseudanabaena sp. RU_4_16]